MNDRNPSTMRYDKVRGRAGTPQRRRGRAVILGFGLDADGHARLTVGRDFRLAGGSEITHQAMLARAYAIQEELDRRGLSTRHITREQYQQIVAVVAMFS